jgi:hypothetical protein
MEIPAGAMKCGHCGSIVTPWMRAVGGLLAMAAGSFILWVLYTDWTATH